MERFIHHLEINPRFSPGNNCFFMILALELGKRFLGLIFIALAVWFERNTKASRNC